MAKRFILTGFKSGTCNAGLEYMSQPFSLQSGDSFEVKTKIEDGGSMAHSTFVGYIRQEEKKRWMILVEVPMTGKPNTSNMSLYVLEYHQIENYEEYPLGAYTGDIVSLHFPANEGLTAAKKIIAAFQGGQRFGGKKEGLFISSIQEYK